MKQKANQKIKSGYDRSVAFTDIQEYSVITNHLFTAIRSTIVYWHHTVVCLSVHDTVHCSESVSTSEQELCPMNAILHLSTFYIDPIPSNSHPPKISKFHLFNICCFVDLVTTSFTLMRIAKIASWWPVMGSILLLRWWLAYKQLFLSDRCTSCSYNL